MFDFALIGGLETRPAIALLRVSDPTFLKTTDHTREYVPLLAYAPAGRNGKALGVRSSFADAGATAAAALGVVSDFGKSFFSEMEFS